MNTKEGINYVVCSACKSHIDIDGVYTAEYWDHWGQSAAIDGFTCDWDPCGADFFATVYRPTRYIDQLTPHEQRHGCSEAGFNAIGFPHRFFDPGNFYSGLWAEWPDAYVPTPRVVSGPTMPDECTAEDAL